MPGVVVSIMISSKLGHIYLIKGEGGKLGQDGKLEKLARIGKCEEAFMLL